MKSTILSSLVLSLSFAPSASMAEELAEVLVSATLRPVAADAIPHSVTVLRASQLRESGVQHLADVLERVPNLTAAGGTSRPRYFQIRGVGEQEQYQGAPNPSVGFLIDDIDFSGVGMPATLLDVQQVEVLRGPQGTVYGASALAGLVNLRTQAPQYAPTLRVESTLGSYGVRSAGVVAGGGFVDGSAAWRAVLQRYRGDGFRRNDFIGRSDTNGFDEGTLRARLAWQAHEHLDIDVSLLDVDLDNGYDAWSIDNSRITHSDAPGMDAQHSRGASLRISRRALRVGELRSITSAADSSIRFDFDGDWGNDAYWSRQSACQPDPSSCIPYDYLSATRRERRTLSQDLRLLGEQDWILGVYALRLTERNRQLDRYNGAVFRALDADYRATNAALYGQVELPLAPRATFTLGLRAEQRQARYADSDGTQATPTDRMLGGNASINFMPRAGERLYATLSRGYKAGGFNIGTALPAERRQFRPEYLWSLEAGWKHGAAPDLLRWQLAAFLMRRQDQQVATSVQVDPSDPLSYQFFTDNAASGENSGVEASLEWRGEYWAFDAAAGLLASRYRELRYRVVTYDAQGNAVVGWRDLSGRDQEYAPRSRLALGAAWRSSAGWFARLEATHTAGFYFSASHDERAAAHTLVNLRAGWQRGAWTVSAWGRNLLDAQYAQHGFYFGNEPPDFTNRLYLQAGDPLQWGITLDYALQWRKE